MYKSFSLARSRRQTLTRAAAMLLALAAPHTLPRRLHAAEPLTVELRGAHLCCNRCRTALEQALRDTAGVTQVRVPDDAPVTFCADDPPAVAAALQAVAAAGFGTQVLVNGSDHPFPLEDIAEDLRADRVVFHEVHICCKSCSRAIAHALESLPNIQSVDCRVKERRVTLTGHDISPHAVRRALLDAGFYGRLER